jgi:hypothetical protein
MKPAFIAVLALMPLLILGQGIRSFTDEDYRNTLRSQHRILFYAFSPSMPLSVDGLKEIHAAAESLGATLVPLADPTGSEAAILKVGDARVRYQRSQFLRDRGLQLHYPSVLVANDHKLLGAPIEGFKTRNGYMTLVAEMLNLPLKEQFQLTREVPLPRQINAFFKPVYGTDLIVIGTWGPDTNSLFDLKTGTLFDIQARGDPGPSPDGEFVTILSAGLRWFSIPDVLNGTSKVLLDDSGLRTYQSVGQLSASSYRVIGALSSSTNPAGLIVRDYEVTRAGPQGKSVAPVGIDLFKEWRTICDGKRISIPMVSKTGQFLSGSYDGTLRVFRLGPNATECDVVFDTKLVTGKADFNREDTELTYVARALNPSTAESVDVIFVADLRTNAMTPVYYGAPTAQLAFPSFISADRIVAYEQSSKKLLALDRTKIVRQTTR